MSNLAFKVLFEFFTNTNYTNPFDLVRNRRLRYMFLLAGMLPSSREVVVVTAVGVVGDVVEAPLSSIVL